ncbi:MAG: amino acid adenylation domain-containing protein [Treponema sp.]|jgi:amino acid adenylation domain-containing protein|nr:amino acid adenylation domain-containing protein [Treponema sp.]
MSVLSDKTFLHAFQQQAARTPERIALSDASGLAVTYSQTQNYANHVSQNLTESGVGRGDIVAIFLGRTAFFPIAAIGAFQAGAAYMPIDPQYPDERVAFMLQDAGAKVLISSRDLVSRVAGYTSTVLYAEDLWVEQEETPEPIINGDDMDYIIYTSGTSGKPKGAMNLHKGLMNLCEFSVEELKLTEQDVCGVYCNFGFDASVVQIFPPLICGAGIDIVPVELMLDMPKLNAYVNEHGITVLPLPAPLVKYFDQAARDTKVKTVVALGDRLTYGPGKNFVVYNMYGPAEASVFVTSFKVDKEYKNYPIGRFIKNNEGYILDENMNPVATGEAGELCFAGVHVGVGYLKRPELTAEKFVKNPFNDAPNYQTLYKTGDLCRLLPDGNYEFLGRIDTQVKIRGFRVELGEIEMTMRKYEGIKEAVCGAFEDKGRGEKYIAAYYTADKELDEGAFKAFLSQTLPFYMIPSVFVKIDAIPFSANGKYDRTALIEPAHRGSDFLSADSQAQTAEEQVLAECLHEILKSKSIDFEKSFSEVGGDSLSAIELITVLIEKRYSLEITELLNPNNSLRDIARLLVPHTTPLQKKPAFTGEKPAEWTEEQFNRVLEQYGQENIERIYDLTLLQTRILKLCLAPAYPKKMYHIQNSYTIEGPLNLELCSKAFALVARKHPALQTAIVHKDVPTPKLLIAGNRGIEITVVVDETIDRVVKQEFRRGFDFEKDNLLRIILIKKGEEYTHLIMSVHHLIIDGWSLSVLMQDFTDLYRQLSDGKEFSLLKESIEEQRKNESSHEDFVNYISKQDQEAAIAYFVKKLEGYNTVADLPHDYANPQGNWDGSVEFLEVPQITVQKINELARHYHVSPSIIYGGTFAFVLQQACGSPDVVFSVLSNERGYPITNITNIAALLINRMQMRVKVTEDTSFAELFSLLQKQLVDDLKYSYVDFLEVIKHGGKYPTSFDYFQMASTFTLADDVVASFDMEYHITSDNIFFTVEAGENTRLRMQYNNHNFMPDTIKRFLNTYLSILEYVITHRDTKLCDAPFQAKKQKEDTQKYELLFQMLKEELVLIRSELSAIRQKVST